jgi:O-antigen ligase
MSFYLLIIATIVSGFNFIGTALSGLLLLIWLGAGLQQTTITKIWIRYPLSRWMLAYLAWLCIAVWWSTAPNTSWLTAWTLAGLPIAYLAWGMTPNPDKIWHALRTSFLLAGPALALWGLGQAVTGYGYGYPVGPLVDKNAFAALMNLFWFMASSHFISKINQKGIHTYLLFFPTLGLLLIATTLFATESRGAILTWLLLMPFALWAGFRATRNKRAVLAVLVIALVGYLGAANLLGFGIGHRTLNLEQDASTSARLLLWKSAADIAKDHPLTGTGWGTFGIQYPAYRDPRENTTAGFYAHNDYVQLAAEGGTPALVLILGIMVGLLMQLKRSLAFKENPRALEATGLLLSSLALFIHAGVNFIFYFTFMNILAGLFAARAVQLITLAGNGSVHLGGLAKIGRTTKVILVSFIMLLLAGPLLLQLLAQTTLSGSQPGLAVLRNVWPTANPYTIAKLITAIRPNSGIAQEIMLQADENALKNSDGISMTGGNFKRELLIEALERFDFVRSQTGNNPGVGVREVNILLAHHNDLPPNVAYEKANAIIQSNLKADPFHANSIIALARLQVMQGHRDLAISTLQRATQNVLSRRDQQLLNVETLRQLAAPQKITELDTIEKQLKNVRSDSETGKPLILPINFSEHIDARLNAIAKTLNH